MPAYDDLNPRQKLFVDHYVIGKNASQAALEAGYSKKTAGKIGSENLAKPEIADAIAERLAAVTNRLEITQDRVMLELARIAFADPRKAVRWGRSPVKPDMPGAEPNALGIYPVELVPSEAMDDDTAATIASVAMTAQGVQIKFHDKLAALKALAEATGVFRERDENAAGALARLLAAAQGTALKPVVPK